MPRQRFSANFNLEPNLPRSAQDGEASPSDAGKPDAEKTKAHPAKPANPEKAAIDDLFSAAYEELRHMAAAVRNRSDAAAPLSPTTLVHEAWIKFAGAKASAFQSEMHFKLTAARAMRQILVEAARRRDSRKRGGNGQVIFVTFDDFAEPIRCDRQILDLNDALDELEKLDERQARIVECRFFGGLEITEIAERMNVSTTTVVRDLRAAKAWLASRLRRTA